jgi:hypothetical protein
MPNNMGGVMNVKLEDEFYVNSVIRNLNILAIDLSNYLSQTNADW